MNTYCAIPGGCHTGGASWGDYTGFAGVKQKAQQASNNIMTRLNQGSMPPTYSTGPKTLSKCELSKIESWINDGCQNN